MLSYQPDCDFVDGQLEDRNVGDWDHSRTMASVGGYLHTKGHHAAISLRVRVSENRVRVPDVAVYLENPLQQAPSIPPFIAIEIVC